MYSDLLSHPYDDIFSAAVVLIGIVIAGIIAYTQWRNGNDKALRASNGDFKLRIEMLEKRVIELTDKVTLLEKENGSMAHLIRESLNLYFTSNPNEAVRLAKQRI